MHELSGALLDSSHNRNEQQTAKGRIEKALQDNKTQQEKDGETGKVQIQTRQTL